MVKRRQKLFHRTDGPWQAALRSFLFLSFFFGPAKSLAPPLANPDIVIVGAGSAGLTAAKFGARFGKSVLLVEKGRSGGDCTWTGCVPSKAMIAAAKAAHVARSGGQQHGVTTGDEGMAVSVSWGAVKGRLQRVIQSIYDADDSPEALRKLNIHLVNATASFLDEDSLLLQHGGSGGGSGSGNNETVVTAKHGYVVATGARPVVPDIPGLATVPFITYEDVFSLPELPKRLTIVGGGPIGCELAQAFQRLSAQVTLVAPKLLPAEDPAAGEVLERVFRKEGVRLVSGRVASVRPAAAVKEGEGKGADSTSGGHVAVTAAGEEVVGDVLLVATGREVVVDSLGLANAGVEYSARGGVVTDRNLRTTSKKVYAAGDCTGGAQFTHVAGFQGAIAARNILLPLSDPGVSKAPVPACTFTAPEVARAGYSQAEAVAEFGAGKVAAVTRPLAEVDRAECDDDEPEGFLKIVYHAKDFRILGALIVAPHAGEMIAEVSVAIEGNVKLPALASVVHVYPSYSIAIQQMAAEVYYEQLERSMPLYNFLKWIGM